MISAPLDFRGNAVVFLAIDGPEPHAISGTQENRRLRTWIEHFHRSASEHPESAGALHGVHAALHAADADGTCRRLRARCRQSRNGQAIGHARHVWLTRGEADEVHVVLSGAVQPDQLGAREPEALGRMRELEAELRAAIEQHQLMLMLQPKGSLSEGTLAGAEALILEGDLAQPGTAERLVAEIVEKFGRLDVVVSNAGFADRRPIGEVDRVAWDASIASMTGAVLTGDQASKRASAACARSGMARLGTFTSASAS